MYKHTIKKLPKQTTEILITVSTSEINKEKNLVFARLQKELTVQGFRKGKVPKALAEKHIDKQKLYEEVLKSLLTKIYEDVVKKENLQPVISPKIDLVKVKEGEDWEIKITIAEKPVVELGKYKEAIKKLKSDQKKDDIWVPGKDKSANASGYDETAKKERQLTSALSALLKEAKCEISDLIIDNELDRRLSQLVDDVRKIGLTVESYLKSRNINIDDLKNRYRKEIEDTYKLEFILGEIADKEGIMVEENEINKLFENIKDEKEKKLAKQNAYYYAAILRKQKTLDFLLGL